MGLSRSAPKGSRNIVSVSWGDHLPFGEGDGRLATPGALGRRIAAWRDQLGAGTVLWRELRSRQDGYFFSNDMPPVEGGSPPVAWDDFGEVCSLCHDAGLAAYLYVTLFDEGWPLADPETRSRSYHNLMHAQHVSWQSRLSRENPAWAVADRSGRERQWGVLCLGYGEVRSAFLERFRKLLAGYPFDGLFLCLRSQSRPAEFADQFGFNDPVRRAFDEQYGRDILKEDFALGDWRDLRGAFLTSFLSELRDFLSGRGVRLAVGVPRGSVIGPPMGNLTLDWRSWLERGIVDDLIIDQNSSRCPSMWHDLWPMHRGYGYLQNYVDGLNMAGLLEDVRQTYGPAAEQSGAALYVARQWSDRDLALEKTLLGTPGISGLVFSSFRFDNPGPVARNDWRFPH